MPPRNPCQKVTPLKCKVSKFDGQDAVPVEYTPIVRLRNLTGSLWSPYWSETPSLIA